MSIVNTSFRKGKLNCKMESFYEAKPQRIHFGIDPFKQMGLRQLKMLLYTEIISRQLVQYTGHSWCLLW